MKGKEPIKVFLTENKKTNTDADTGGFHTCSITDTSSVNSEAGSITTGGWWCELERENNSVRQTSHIQQK